MTWDVRQGDCRELLRAMPAESVHCVVTSPPYWGLRDYGLPPLVWGGDAACEHSWGEEQRQIIENRTTANLNRNRTGEQDNGLWGEVRKSNATQGAFCRHCHAWRGSLGLEPTPDCGRPFSELREDLSEKERAYVIAELTRLGLIQEPSLESEGQP